MSNMLGTYKKKMQFYNKSKWRAGKYIPAPLAVEDWKSWVAEVAVV